MHHVFDKYRVDLPEMASETMRIERFTISPEEAKVEGMRMLIHGAGYRAPRAGTYTRIIRNGRLWMSDTDAEVRDHLEAIRQIGRRGGRILINGLGIGLIVHAALQFENVEHIDIVEIDQEVCDVVGSHYARDPRVQVHCDDAHTIKWPAGMRWDVAWHDIWANISLDDVESRSKLNRRYGRRVGWQAGWADYEIEQAKRQDRMSPWRW